MAVAKEQIRQIISENNINSVADIYTLLKDSFKDILQELMEAELDATLGYEKNHKGDLQTDNKRNGHSTKNLKSQYGEFQIDVPRDRNGEFEPKLIPKYQRDISGIEEKVISLYARGMSTRDIHDQLQDLYGIELCLICGCNLPKHIIHLSSILYLFKIRIQIYGWRNIAFFRPDCQTIQNTVIILYYLMNRNRCICKFFR